MHDETGTFTNVTLRTVFAGLSVSATVRHPLIFLSQLLSINTRGRQLHHRLLHHPTSSQQFINHTIREVDREWSVVFRCTFAKSVHLYTQSAHTSQRVSNSVPLSIVYLFLVFKSTN